MSQAAPPNPLGYRQRFPWLNLFRAFQIAIGPRKLLLGFLGVVLLLLGEWLIGLLPFAPANAFVAREQSPWPLVTNGRQPLISVEAFARNPVEVTLRTATEGSVLARPLLTVVTPLARLFSPRLTWSDVAYLWTSLLWVLLVWVLIGGALTRMAAVQFARDQSVGVIAAVRFSATKTLSCLAAVLMPFLAIGFFWICGRVVWLLGHIPGAGPVLLGILWGLLLLFGIGMALILLALAVGWPLMVAAISTEDGDAFDGLSRAYNFIFDRPWHLLWYALVATIYGSAVFLFVSLVASLAVYLTGWMTSLGVGDEVLSIASGRMTGSDAGALNIGGTLVAGWLRIVAMVVAGFMVSYFWTAATIIYFLLRKSDDGVVLDQVTIAEERPPRVPLPVVGIAGNEHESQSAAPADTPKEQA